VAETKPPLAATLRRIERAAGSLATSAVTRMDETLPWFRALPADQRSWVMLVAQAGVRSLVEWLRSGGAVANTQEISDEVFAAAPRALARSITLTQAVQLIKVTIDVAESEVAYLAAAGEEEALLTAILRFSREIAFSAARVYARAAESRGAWDARLEALVVDSILSGEYDDELPSRIAALGWHGHGEVAVLVGTAPKQLDVDHVRRAARHMHADVLIGVQGNRLVLVIGRSDPLGREPEETIGTSPALTFMEIATQLEPHFGPGHLVLGHEVPNLVDASKSAKAALAGFAVARSWRHAPRPVHADDLLPERALAGDPLARATLVHRIYRPLQAHSTELLTTLWSYLDNGRSLEATARELFVHPNTVRYRLKRVSDVIGWDATGAREALILQSALIIGSMSDHEHQPRRRQG